MAKIFKTSEDIAEFIEQKFEETELHVYGINLKIMSVTKAKDIIKISKASATTEFLAKSSDMVQVFVYEAAFDRLPDDAKNMLVEMALSNIAFDSEKDKILIESHPFMQLFAMRQKYGDTFMDKLELGYHIIKEIEEEEKAKKEAEKEAKRAKKNE